MDDEAVTRIASLFDELSVVYDPTDVPFFGPIAAGLIELLAPMPGDRVLDLGCGTGAATVLLASAVGPAGSVTAVDISAGMIQQLDQLVAQQRLTQVVTHRADVSDPDPGWGSVDVLAASLVLFFLPDPQRALECWMALVADGGRLGISTFGPQDPVWRSVDALFDPYLPAGMLDARTSGAAGPFVDDAGVEGLFRSAGIGAVRTVTREVTVAFDDVDGWRRWSRTTGQRQMWDRIPIEQLDAFLEQAAALLEPARRSDTGHLELTQQARYTLATITR